MEYVYLVIIGLITGLFGGMLGIGGAIIMIPSLVIVFGENQHLYQAAAMITSFFVSTSSLIAHRKAEAFVPGMLKWMIPGAILGVITGVTLSNLQFFAGQNSYLLTRFFGFFLAYIVVYNIFRLRHGGFSKDVQTSDLPTPQTHPVMSVLIGLVTGTAGGLLGIGGGSLCTPLQQVLTKMPLKRAMSNSAVVVSSMVWLGAVYKNATLSEHGTSVVASLKIAAVVVPTAILGGFLGGHLMHKLHRNWVRIAFVIVAAAGAFKMLSIGP